MSTASSSSTAAMAFKPPFNAPCCDCNGGICKSSRCVNQIKEKRTSPSLRKIDLGPVPSSSEVEAALTSLLSFLQEICSSELRPTWLQPMLDFYDSRILHSDGYRWVCKICQWLQTDPSFKRLVISLCLDKAVWDAIVNNETVGKLVELPPSGENGIPEGFQERPDWVSIILRWILDMTLTKIVKLVEGFLMLLNSTCHFHGNEKPTLEDRDQVEEKAKASLILSFVILLIVVVARVQIA